MSLKEALDSGKFLITAEIGPGKGTDTGALLEDASAVKDCVDAINVTDMQSSVMRLASMPVCHLLKDMGVDPILQVTCRDRNRLAIQADLLGAWALGIRNVLALTGDHPTLGDHPQAKPVFDLDSVSLLEVITKLGSGVDMAGHELKGAPDFLSGAVVNPGADTEAAIELQIIKMEKKIAAGARFFQTQAVYDFDLFEKFMRRVEGLNVPIIGGVILLKSAGMARFMNKNVAGVLVPTPLIKEMADTKDRVKKSVEIAARIVKRLKNLCQGVHIMALGWEKTIPAVLDQADI